MRKRVKFIRVSYQQIVSRLLSVEPRARDLESVFRVPCDVREMYVVSRIVAKQYGISRNAIVLCSDGEAYATSALDIGTYGDECEVVSYLIKVAFGVRSWDATKLDHIVKRCTALGVEDHVDKVTILYSL
ncbi:MAG: hypothetical protein GXO32_02710 [Crenarchaeota archaeon]|nr:hypothetical protein [Thermoproteota archaeon]